MTLTRRSFLQTSLAAATAAAASRLGAADAQGPRLKKAVKAEEQDPGPVPVNNSPRRHGGHEERQEG